MKSFDDYLAEVKAARMGLPPVVNMSLGAVAPRTPVTHPVVREEREDRYKRLVASSVALNRFAVKAKDVPPFGKETSAQAAKRRLKAIVSLDRDKAPAMRWRKSRGWLVTNILAWYSVGMALMKPRYRWERRT